VGGSKNERERKEEGDLEGRSKQDNLSLETRFTREPRVKGPSVSGRERVGNLGWLLLC